MGLIFVYLIMVGCAPPERGTISSIDPGPPVTKTDPSGVYMIRGRPLLWPPTRLPVTLAFAKGTPPALAAACRAAGQTFNDAAGRALFRFAERDVAPAPNFEATSGTNLISYGRRPPTDQDEVGVAHTIYANAQILEVHIDFNPAKLNLRGDHGAADPEASCLHELGHALGFTHQADAASVMFPFEQMHRRRLSADDQARLRRHYGQ